MQASNRVDPGGRLLLHALPVGGRHACALTPRDDSEGAEGRDAALLSTPVGRAYAKHPERQEGSPVTPVSGRQGVLPGTVSLSCAPRRLIDEPVLFERYMRGEAGAYPGHLAYLDRGIDASPLRSDVAQYRQRLEALPVPGPTSGPLFPNAGELPQIEGGLEFLHPDISQATVCVSTFDGHAVHSRWMGRHALDSVEQWSASKLIPIERLAALAGTASPGVDLARCLLRDPSGNLAPRRLPAIIDDIVSYRAGTPTSNAWARALKQFDTPSGIESWLRAFTGNRDPALEFRGGYGSPPAVARPQLVDGEGHLVLQASGADHTGANHVSSYDLCRLIAAAGLHNRLPAASRLPGTPWSALSAVVGGLGVDSARFTDVAMETLGLSSAITAPVVLSKMGFGYSQTRRTVEMVYTAYVELQLARAGEQPRWVSVAMSLRGALPSTSSDPRALELDARMAAAVTQILERVTG